MAVAPAWIIIGAISLIAPSGLVWLWDMNRIGYADITKDMDRIPGHKYPSPSPRPDKKRSINEVPSGTLVYFLRANLSEANMAVMNGMRMHTLDETADGHKTIFKNDAKNFTTEGIITGLETPREHGIMHGHLYVPMGDQVVEGNWLQVKPGSAAEDKVNAFQSFKRAHAQMLAQHEQLQSLLDLVTADDAGEK